MVASTATYPHEVIRSHMHIEGVGSFQAFLRTCRQVHSAELRTQYSRFLLVFSSAPAFWFGTSVRSIQSAPVKRSNLSRGVCIYDRAIFVSDVAIFVSDRAIFVSDRASFVSDRATAPVETRERRTGGLCCRIWYSFVV